MSEEDFPALFRAADAHSNEAQRSYLILVRLQYFLLLIATVFAFLASQHNNWKLAYVVVLVASAAALLYMSTVKPEKDWYKFRALAESVKTRTWLFVIGGEPFSIDKNTKQIESEFIKDLEQILAANHHVRERIKKFPKDGEQITDFMRIMRTKNLEDRKTKYARDRIEDQKQWYTAKSDWNDRKFRLWVVIAVCIHAAAILYVLFASRAVLKVFPLPTDLLLVSASAVLGWMQIKRFNELAGSYALTAHEISLVEGRLDRISVEGDLAEFVSEAELLFSREHTQWAAREPN